MLIVLYSNFLIVLLYIYPNFSIYFIPIFQFIFIPILYTNFIINIHNTVTKQLIYVYLIKLCNPKRHFRDIFVTEKKYPNKKKETAKMKRNNQTKKKIAKMKSSGTILGLYHPCLFSKGHRARGRSCSRIFGPQDA